MRGQCRRDLSPQLVDMPTLARGQVEDDVCEGKRGGMDSHEVEQHNSARQRAGRRIVRVADCLSLRDRPLQEVVRQLIGSQGLWLGLAPIPSCHTAVDLGLQHANETAGVDAVGDGYERREKRAQWLPNEPEYRRRQGHGLSKADASFDQRLVAAQWGADEDPVGDLSDDPLRNVPDNYLALLTWLVAPLRAYTDVQLIPHVRN